jgi:hypothetical protein
MIEPGIKPSLTPVLKEYMKNTGEYHKLLQIYVLESSNCIFPKDASFCFCH